MAASGEVRIGGFRETRKIALSEGSVRARSNQRGWTGSADKGDAGPGAPLSAVRDVGRPHRLHARRISDRVRQGANRPFATPGIRKGALPPVHLRPRAAALASLRDALGGAPCPAPLSAAAQGHYIWTEEIVVVLTR